MHKMLKAFGFGPDVLQWIKIFYSNIKSVVLAKGKVTS